jgi:hypothetical protein
MIAHELSDNTVAAIDRIIASNERIRQFWTMQASGWAPRESTSLLEKSRIDRLVSLSHSLRLWTQPCADEDDEGRLILAWANLGILVEGTLTWFLCVYANDYAKSPMQTGKGHNIEPNGLRFHELTTIFHQHVWTDRQKIEWHDWLTMVRKHRNAVHAFNHREIGTWDDWAKAVIRYHDLVDELDSQVPYPDSNGYC